MKWRRSALRIGLITVILASFYLTYLIWLNPSNKRGIDAPSNIEGNENTSVTREEVNPRKVIDVFLPLQLVEVIDNQAKETVTESAIKKVTELIGTGKLVQTQYTEFKTEKEFIENTNLANGIELNYLNQISLNDTISLHDLNFRLTNDLKAHPFTYDRIQIDFTNNQLYIINTLKKQKMTATISTKMSRIQEELTDDKITWCPVIYSPTILVNQYISSEPINMKMYSYISSVQPYSLFRDSFFRSDTQSQNSDDRLNLLVISQSEMMTVQMKDRLIDYRDTNLSKNDQNMYMKSFDYIRNLGNNYGNLRFINQSSSTLNYRVFVEGYPIFSDGNEGLISLQFSDNPQSSSRSLRIQANMNTIQVPIPSEQVIALPASKQVLAQLEGYGVDFSKVSGIMIGYKWSDVKDAEVVDLLPTWFVNYEGKWLSIDRLMSKLAGREEN